MSKTNSKTKKINSHELIEIFHTSAKEGYERLISSGNHTNNNSHEFWELFEKEQEEIYAKNPENEGYIEKTGKLHLFCQLLVLYQQNKLGLEKEISSINPDSKTLIQSLFLILELKGNLNINGYSVDSLSSIKKIYYNLTGGGQLKPENQTGYTLTLFNKLKLLVEIHDDLKITKEFMDLFLWAEFDLSQKVDSTGYLLHLCDTGVKKTNPYILNELKKSVKNAFKKSESNKLISQEKHFEQIDKTYKTNEGLATVYHSAGVTAIDQAQGMTSLQIDDSILYGMTSKDPVVSEEAKKKMLKIVLEQNFHSRLRDAFTSIYQPNDRIDLHTQKIKIKEHYVSLYEIFAALSSIIALADRLRYVDSIEGKNIDTLKRMGYQMFSEKIPKLSEIEKISLIKESIANNYLELEKTSPNYNLFEIGFFFEYFRKVEELKNKSDKELQEILNLFCDINNQMPFLPIYKVEGEKKYYFSYKTCLNTDLNRILYDYFVSKKLFDRRRAQGELEKTKISKNSDERSSEFGNELKKIIKNLTPFVGSDVKYPSPKSEFFFEKIFGDFDVIAYFKEENLILPIQIKLSNTTSINEFSKAEWVQNNIKIEGCKQVKKDITFIEHISGKGLNYISHILNTGFEIPKTVNVYPLIVTDNFYSDHQRFGYNDKGDEVSCISFFEMENLIKNVKVHKKQKDFYKPNQKTNILDIIEIIEKNKFWNFIDENIDDVHLTKELQVINEENRITLRI